MVKSSASPLKEICLFKGKILIVASLTSFQTSSTQLTTTPKLIAFIASCVCCLLQLWIQQFTFVMSLETSNDTLVKRLKNWCWVFMQELYLYACKVITDNAYNGELSTKSRIISFFVLPFVYLVPSSNCWKALISSNFCMCLCI